jgi:hypothetical protein
MMRDNLVCVCAEALFVSDVQRSDAATALRVRTAVAESVRRHGSHGCAVLVAQEFGEHPDTAAGRMSWALTAVRSAYVPAA